ncbi:uncharacterized protein PRCAT00001495001 [Priceomyces carsonii]|uniref:uncharacterized protein n=1 Tax=Priceomyces carsonii TaxID=28549 RepID=UPI002ED88501|nr:unnamed protein product [Priceomyces carsonii]
MTSEVLVTGASGFISQHIVKLLIERGYKVIGTVRDDNKGKNLVANVGSDNFSYEVVPNIIEEGAFDKALSSHPNVKYLLHTASPFFYDTTDPEKDLIIPAIKGTQNILKAVKEYCKNVERVVITSSDAAIYSADDEQNSSLKFDEASWNKISYQDALKDPIAAYYGAKSFAEKLAWDFMEKEKPIFKLTAVNPVYVFGPQAFDSEVKEKLNTSNELIHTLIKLGPDDKFDNDKGGFIDVRDVARGHIAAFELETTVGKRLFLTNGHFSTQMMLDIINKNFPSLKGNIPTGNPGTGQEDIKTLAKVDNQKTRDILKFEFRSLEETVIDTVSQLLEKLYSQ